MHDQVLLRFSALLIIIMCFKGSSTPPLKKSIQLYYRLLLLPDVILVHPDPAKRSVYLGLGTRPTGCRMRCRKGGGGGDMRKINEWEGGPSYRSMISLAI